MAETYAWESGDRVIAVMGVTGAGKSHFIRTATGDKAVVVGRGVESVTKHISAHRVRVGDQQVVLLDTPGFNDTSRSNAQIFRDIAIWLAKSYVGGNQLTAILYLHRITDRRLAGSDIRSLSIFRKLVGDSNLRNVVLVTTMWDRIDIKDGLDRQRELLGIPGFWGEPVRSGSIVTRFDGTREGACSVLQLAMDKTASTLSIQKEIIDDHLQLSETEAGKELQSQEDINDLRPKLAKASSRGDEVTVRSLAMLSTRSNHKPAKAQAEIDALRSRNSEIEAFQIRHKQETKSLRDSFEDRIQFLAAGADVGDATGGNGRTALQTASERGHLEVVERPLAASRYGLTALQAASERSHLDVVERLLAAGADANDAATGWNGQPALQAASECGYLEVIERLLAAGADVDAASTGWNGRTALQAASECGHLEVVERLLTAGADVNAAAGRNDRTALQAASERGHLKVIERLLAAGANVNAAATTWNGRTALQAASECGHLEVVERLLGAGADVNDAAIGGNGRTALQAASECGHLEVVERLLAAGADVNADASRYGRTALQAASEHSHLEVVERLLAAGADVNAAATSWSGRTALQAASENGHLEVVERLLAAGANVNAAASRNGRTALQAASECGHLEVVEKLLGERATPPPPASVEAGTTSEGDDLGPARSDASHDTNTSRPPIFYIRTLSIYFRRLIQVLLRPRVPAGYRRLEWTCTCGESLYGDFKGSPGSVNSLAARLQEHSSGVPGQSASLQSPGASPNKGHLRRSNSLMNWNLPNDSGQGGPSDPAGQAFVGGDLGASALVRETLQLCIETGRYSLELGELQLEKPYSDGILFQRIRQRYEHISHSVLPMRLRFRKPDKAVFVKFRVGKRPFVSPVMGSIDAPSIPAESEVIAGNYKYNPCPIDVPPIDSRTFLHHFYSSPSQHPDMMWGPRIPRKLGPSLAPMSQGWGIYLEECPDWPLFAALNFIFLLLGGMVAGIYSWKTGDRQTGVAIGTWLTAVQAMGVTAVFFWWKLRM